MTRCKRSQTVKPQVVHVDYRSIGDIVICVGRDWFWKMKTTATPLMTMVMTKQLITGITHILKLTIQTTRVFSVMFSLLCFLCYVFSVMFSLLCFLCYVISVMFSLLCYLCYVISVMFSVLCFLCYVISVMFSLLCYLCYVFSVMFSLLCFIHIQLFVYSLLKQMKYC